MEKTKYPYLQAIDVKPAVLTVEFLEKAFEEIRQELRKPHLYRPLPVRVGNRIIYL